jgi:hypothetical protein
MMGVKAPKPGSIAVQLTVGAAVLPREAIGHKLV